MLNIQQGENSENSDDISNLSTDKNKPSNKRHNKTHNHKSFSSGFILDRKNHTVNN
jgi:hypothetical protein